MFAGGALSRMSIICIKYYAIYFRFHNNSVDVIHFFTLISAFKKDGESGRQKTTQYTRYGTVFLASIQALGIASGLEGMTNSSRTCHR